MFTHLFSTERRILDKRLFRKKWAFVIVTRLSNLFDNIFMLRKV